MTLCVCGHPMTQHHLFRGTTDVKKRYCQVMSGPQLVRCACTDFEAGE
jgi:hypothetical protein